MNVITGSGPRDLVSALEEIFGGGTETPITAEEREAAQATMNKISERLKTPEKKAKSVERLFNGIVKAWDHNIGKPNAEVQMVELVDGLIHLDLEDRSLLTALQGRGMAMMFTLPLCGIASEDFVIRSRKTDSKEIRIPGDKLPIEIVAIFPDYRVSYGASLCPIIQMHNKDSFTDDGKLTSMVMMASIDGFIKNHPLQEEEMTHNQRVARDILAEDEEKNPEPKGPG